MPTSFIEAIFGSKITKERYALEQEIEALNQEYTALSGLIDDHNAFGMGIPGMPRASDMLAELDRKRRDKYLELEVYKLYQKGEIAPFMPKNPGSEDEIVALREKLGKFSVPEGRVIENGGYATERYVHVIRIRTAELVAAGKLGRITEAQQFFSPSGPTLFSSSTESEVKDSNDSASYSEPELESPTNSFAPVSEPNDVEDLDPMYSKFGI